MPLWTQPIPAVASFIDFSPVHQTDLNTLSANLTNLYGYTLGGFRTQRPLAAVRCTTQTIPNAQDATLVWDTKDLDYDNMWSGSTATALVVNTPGVYRIYTQSGQNGPLANVLVTYACVNGTGSADAAVGVMSTNAGIIGACQATVGLQVGSTIFGIMYQNTGASQTVRTVYGGCRLAVAWIAPL